VTDPVQYNPYDYRIHEDPYPTYARLREEAPLYHNGEQGFWALSRHEDVIAGFRNPAQLSNRFGVSLDPAAYGPEAHRAMSFLGMDPPRHTRMRSLVSKGFTPRRVADLEVRIQRIATDHLDAALQREEFDFVADLAGLLPMDVISEMLGLPSPDRVELRRLSDALVHREEGFLDVPATAVHAALSLAGYFADLIAARRRAPGPDLTSALTVAEIDGDRLTDDEVISFLILMIVAGNETTTKLLSNAWYWAWRYPDTKAAVLAAPDRVSDWIEETLRYDTSTQMLVRVTTGAVELLGETIPDSCPVLLLLGSANRDPRVFPEPDRYDIDRDTSKLISFGAGRHFCLGAALARLEARVVLRLIAERVADYDVDGDRIARMHSANVRGFASLPSTAKAR
jgi:cytochrome P450